MGFPLKNMGLVCMAVILLAASSGSAESPGQPDKTITIATGEWAPWTGMDLPYNGFVCRVVEDVFSRAGYEVDFAFYPWQRAYAMILQGRADASAYWYISDRRKEDAYYSDPLTREKIVFFHLKTEPMADWETLADLEPYRIGVSRGNTYTDELWEMGEQGVLTLDKADGDLANFRKLLAGRIDIFPCSKLRGYTLLNAHFSEGTVALLAHHETPLDEPTGHLIFPRGKDGSLALKRVFNAHLRQLRDEGVYRKYIEILEHDAYSKHQ